MPEIDIEASLAPLKERLRELEGEPGREAEAAKLRGEAAGEATGRGRRARTTSARDKRLSRSARAAPGQRPETAPPPGPPYTRDSVQALGTEFTELKGNRHFAD